MGLLNKLSGYKTYITAIGIIMAGFNMIGAGDWQGGILHVIQAPEFIVILGGMGLASLRLGVEKLLVALQSSNAFNNDDVPSMNDYLFVDHEGIPISKAQYNKTMKDLDLTPVMGLKAK